MKPNPLSILFGGLAARAVLIDGTKVDVFVRALPQCYLHLVLTCAEHKHLLIELCTYFKTEKSAKKSAPVGAPFAPDVVAPAGYVPVPMGWNQNLSDASIDELYELAKHLNFQRAADWAKGQIAAKKMVAPLYEMTVSQVMPVVNRIMQPLIERVEKLSASMPSAPSSSGAAGNPS
jgi:hypothetical protein